MESYRVALIGTIPKKINKNKNKKNVTISIFDEIDAFVLYLHGETRITRSVNVRNVFTSILNTNGNYT